MARLQATIYNQILNNYVTTAAGVGINLNILQFGTAAQWANFPFVSMYNLQGLMMWIVAGGVAIFEQIQDAWLSFMEGLVAISPPQTAIWIQNFVLNVFQYNATTPRIIQFDEQNIAPFYPIVVAAERIVSQCVVVPGFFGTTTVKVATGNPAAALTTGAGGQLPALQSALNLTTIPGVNINATTGNADKIFVQGIVTYNGQYSSVIPVANGTVVLAIIAYLASIPTSGIAGVSSTVGLMKLTDLIAAVRAVPGVIDFELINVNARADGATFIPGTNNLVSGANWLQNEYNSGLLGAGYMLTETSTGYTINDSLTYNPQ